MTNQNPLVEVGTKPPANLSPAQLVDEHIAEAFNLTQAKIAELRTCYMPLTIKGVDDKAGYAAVRAARMDVRKFRIDVDKRRKELKKESQDYLRKVETVADILTAPLVEIENHLDAEETRVDEAKAVLAEEKRKAAQATLQARVDALALVGGTGVDLHTLGGWTDGQFATFLADKTARFQEAEAQRLADEEALEKQRQAQAAEQARLDAIKAEQAAKAAELQAKQDTIDAKEKAAAQKEREERIAKEAADKARIDAQVEAARKKADEERKVREDKERAEREAEEAKARAAAIEAARPDAEKLRAFAAAVAALDLPQVSTAEGRAAVLTIQTALAEFCQNVRLLAADMVEAQPAPAPKAAANPKGVVF